VAVSVDLSPLDETCQAVITVAAASGATVNAAASTVYIGVPEDAAKQASGADAWNLVGSFDAIALEKTADEPETWMAENVSLSAPFKFSASKGGSTLELGADGAVAVDSDIVLSKDGGEITLEEGFYTVTLYPGELRAVITVGENPDGVGDLDWTVVCNGLGWVEGYYRYGQLTSIEVSDTDGSYYIPMIVYVDDEGSLIDRINAYHDAVFEELQDELTEALQDEMDIYGETLDEALYYVLYKEENDGTELIYQLDAGNYEFAVFPVDNQGKLDGRYKIISFTQDEDALATYPWVDNANQNAKWTAEWDGWVEDNEGVAFWVSGNASGAAYVTCQWFTDEEIDYYFDGDLTYMLNYYGSSLWDTMAAGYTADELLYPVSSDGSFSATLKTYSTTGPVNVYIYGFDAEGKVIADYGVSEVVIPEIEFEWKERTDWACNYDPEYPGQVVATACDADYFIMEVYEPGYFDDISDLDEVSDDAFYYVANFGLSTCLAYGYAFDSVPAVLSYPYFAVVDGNVVFMFGVKSSGQPTGEWHSEVITGVGGSGGGDDNNLEMTFMENWTVEVDNDSYEDDYADITVHVPGLGGNYYFVEEATWADIESQYSGSLSTFAKRYESYCAYYLNYYSMEDIMPSAFWPQEDLYVNNPGVQSTIYIFEYDEDGKATGRYGATDTVMPGSSYGYDRLHVASAKTSGRKVDIRKPLQHVDKAATCKMVKKQRRVKNNPVDVKTAPAKFERNGRKIALKK